MEIFPSPDRNRKTTLFARPSSRFLSRPVEGTGHVQHGAITRSFRFFHLLDPLLVSFQPKFHGKQGGEGRLFRSSCSYSKLQGGKGARDAQRSARRAGQIEAEEGKRALILLRLKPFDPSSSTHPSHPLFPSSPPLLYRALSKRTGSKRRARFERICVKMEDTLRALQLRRVCGRDNKRGRISRRASFTSFTSAMSRF